VPSKTRLGTCPCNGRQRHAALQQRRCRRAVSDSSRLRHRRPKPQT
jgi:hypothetical protein